MNTNMKWTKTISVALLVAITAFATTGLVLADHYTPLDGVSESSLSTFDLYHAAMDNMETDQADTVASLHTEDSTRGQVNFVRYLDEYDQTGLDRNSVKVKASITRVGTGSQDSYMPYLDEYDQTGLEKHSEMMSAQSSEADDSLLYWELYLKYAR